MYSVLMSKFENAYPLVKLELSKIIKDGSKVVVVPWSFATELKTKKIDEYFNDRRKKKYIEPLCDLGINKKNIVVLDCYNDSISYMSDKIQESDVLVLTGGNPEMLCKKIKECNLLYILKNYKGIIIGSSAGAEIQLKKYFITKKNNYHKKFDWYDGIGIIDNNFYFDVHSINKGRYLPSLKRKSIEQGKDIYCLFDDGVIFYNRETKIIKCYGKYVLFKANHNS